VPYTVRPNLPGPLVNGLFDPKRQRQTADAARKIGFYTLIPTMLAVGPILGYLLGSWLERRFDHSPWFAFGGILLGLAASVRQIIVILRRAQS
jgi:ATP synthase protein I